MTLIEYLKDHIRCYENILTWAKIMSNCLRCNKIHEEQKNRLQI